MLPGSPAIDAGDDSVLGPPLNLATDQRGAGFPRLQGTHVDIGAYEAEPPPPDTPQTSPITVTKTGDSNDGFCGVADCSLREAIASAASGDSIVIPMGVYTLSRGTELLIDNNLTLTGAGSGDTIIEAATSSADATSRVFNITASGDNVAMSDVTIRHGNASGSSPADQGGGIFNSGTLTLTDSTVSDNSASSPGGGVYNNATLTLTTSTVSGNTAIAGGGISNSIGGTLTLINSTVSGNLAVFGGGGIRNQGTLTLTSSSISGNTAGVGGGVINAIGATITVTNSTVTGNKAKDHGGIFNGGGTLTITDSTISGNTGHDAVGGIHNNGTLTITNSTVSSNTTNGDTGGISNQGTLTITNSTISGNSANGSFGGIRNDGTAEIINTIIYGNNAPIAPDCTSSLISLGHNLFGTDCGVVPATADQVKVIPLLGLLADNGGPTLTHALLPGSPAIDAGDDSVLSAPHNLTTDQRGAGFPRFHGAHMDIGAYEAEPLPAPLTPPLLVSPANNVVVNTSIPPFAWEPSVGDVVDYLLQVTSGDIVTGPYDIERVIAHPGTGHQVATPLADAIYNWRVIARGAALNTATSVVWSFTVATAPVTPTCHRLAATLVGTDGDDILIGTTGDDVIVGLGGNDIILGLGGNDTICGGKGADFIHGGSGADWLFGGAGHDEILGGDGPDRLMGGGGNDFLRGGQGDDRLFGKSGHDVLEGGSGNDRLVGGRGHDVSLGRNGDDTFNCGPGFDFAGGGAGTDTVIAGCEISLRIP